MFLTYNPDSFLSGDAAFVTAVPVEESRTMFHAELAFENHHEGFIGIPHGGLPMGLCLDAWRRVGFPSYPIQVHFKFGGSGISIGEAAMFSVEYDPTNGVPQVCARITKPGDKTPYLSAQIRPASGSQEPFRIPTLPIEEFRLLPYYENCFVCGHHRTVVGLQRRFRLHEASGLPIVTTPWGESSEDSDRVESFLIGGDELHPAVLISIFDENTAWGGFMSVRAAGLSVRLDFILRRPVKKHEKLLFVGRPAGFRGNPKAPRFFKAEGTILATADSRAPEVVAYGHGEWIILEHYTEQIKKNLLPDGDWSWIFRGKENGSL